MKDLRVWGLVLLVACGGETDPEPGVQEPAPSANPLHNPDLATERAPDTFRARFTTTKGDFVIKAERKWSPAGADRLYNLVRIGYFEDTPFYRVLPSYIAQFGFHPEKKVNAAWNTAFLPAEPNRLSNMRGTLVFAQRGRAERTVQFFINLDNNSGLDGSFSPVAMVTEGMDVVDSIYSNYREGPSQRRIANEGLPYLRENYPSLDYIQKAELLAD